jgi:hypothetical protein
MQTDSVMSRAGHRGRGRTLLSELWFTLLDSAHEEIAETGRWEPVKSSSDAWKGERGVFNGETQI